MIGKTIKGSSALGILRYVLGPEKCKSDNARVIATSLDGHTVEEMAAEINAIRRFRPGLKKAIYHQILSAPAEEGDNLSDKTWREIAVMHARAMGYVKGQWVAVRHSDGHIHIIANRVLLDGSVVSDSQDWKRAERSVRAIEKKFELTQVKSSHLLDPEEVTEHERAPTQTEKALEAKGEVSVRELIQDQLLGVLDSPQTFTDFSGRLHERGVLVRPNIQSTGRLAGLSFVLEARPALAFSGTSLGRRFTLGNLRKAGLDYDPLRDHEAVQHALQRCDELEALQKPPTGENQRPSQPRPMEPRVLEKKDDALQPLVDPKTARRHLEALGAPVMLAARDRTGRVKELGVVDAQNIGAWRRRLRRRCALGEDVVVRPVQGSPLLVLPQLRQGEMMTLDKLGIEPFLVVNREPKLHDAWIRVAGDESVVDDLRARLRDINLYPAKDGMAWGSLTGYRPDPVSKGTSTASRIMNRIGLIADTVVDVSQDLLERLRRLAERRKPQRAPDASSVTPRHPKERGRSR